MLTSAGTSFRFRTGRENKCSKSAAAEKKQKPNQRRLLFILTISIWSAALQAQVHSPMLPPYTDNSIANSEHLRDIFKKISNLQKSVISQVRIVHLGDSHIQNGILAGTARNILQKRFGNAGPGLIFPYRIAGTSGKNWVNFQTTSHWTSEKITQPQSLSQAGLCGYLLSTGSPDPEISLQTKDSFQLMRVFLRHSAKIRINNTGQPEQHDSLFRLTNHPYMEVYQAELEKPVQNCSIQMQAAAGKLNFHGLSLEKKSPGILYHDIGINSARYDHFVNDSLFWRQIEVLGADLYIISLGTNEAQNKALDPQKMLAILNQFTERLQKTAPRASVLIIAPALSCKSGKPNLQILEIGNLLASFALSRNFAFFDYNRAVGSPRFWLNRLLLSGDLVHYTEKGYQLQGLLLAQALLNEYNKFLTAPQNLR